MYFTRFFVFSENIQTRSISVSATVYIYDLFVFFKKTSFPRPSLFNKNRVGPCKIWYVRYKLTFGWQHCNTEITCSGSGTCASHTFSQRDNWLTKTYDRHDNWSTSTVSRLTFGRKEQLADMIAGRHDHWTTITTGWHYNFPKKTLLKPHLVDDGSLSTHDHWSTRTVGRHDNWSKWTFGRHDNWIGSWKGNKLQYGGSCSSMSKYLNESIQIIKSK